MRTVRTDFLIGLALAGLAQHAAAEVAKIPALPPPPPSAVAAPAQAPSDVPSTPQQTTASFADWILRCSRASASVASCEVVQSISNQDRTVAQMAIGRTGKGQPLHFTLLVPPGVTLSPSPALGLRDGDPPAVELGWRRCLPGGCLADAVVSDDMLGRLRTWTEPGRVTYADGSGRPTVLPFSPRGLSQALDALAKEDAG